MENRKSAEETLRWMKKSGIEGELVDLAYVFVRSALNRILFADPGHEIYADITAIRQNLLGQASVICMLNVMRRPEHMPRDWPAEKMILVADRTMVVYGQLLRFIAGMIDRQDTVRKMTLAPFRKTLEELAREVNASLEPNPT